MVLDLTTPPWAFFISILIRSLAFLPVCRAQQPVSPAVLPLAIRSPYLSSWNGLLLGPICLISAEHYFQPLGWNGLALVDGVPYIFLSDFRVPSLNTTSTLMSTVVTPTRTILTIQAGPMEFNVTFLSPIEPGNWIRQSVPFSYMYIDAQSLDRQNHSVQLYSSIGGDWASIEQYNNITWTTTSTESSFYHGVAMLHADPFTEAFNDSANWGTAYYATQSGPLVSYKTGDAPDTISQFSTQRHLDDLQDVRFREIRQSTQDSPAFAFAKDLGNISSAQQAVIWALGAIRDPTIQYNDLDGATHLYSSYFYSNPDLENAGDLVDSFLEDFPNAVARATALDNKIVNAASAVSPAYADLVSIAARQAYGATELAIAKGADGSWNKSDVMMFMKKLGTPNADTDMNRVNAVETLYAAFPVFMYIDASLGAPLLEPLFRFQTSIRYVNPYAARDVGSAYPIAAASTVPHQQGIEQTGNMLIMASAYVRASGDVSQVDRYYSLLRRWTDYLVNNTLFTENQLSADNDPTNNQTNLALKGIIAVKAMSQICTSLNQSADADYYSGQASGLYEQWASLALASSDKHILAMYGQESSWSLGYNLFADRWIGTNLVNSSVSDAHTQFLGNLIASSSNTTFGMPISSTNITIIASSWNLFMAAVASDLSVKNSIVSSIHNAASYSPDKSRLPFPVLYNSSDGSILSGSSRQVLCALDPAQGAVFAPLALT
ncbi:hypothetical protein BV25DRAFT_1797287 [Artomyces pyxidatus]|uniref:Uncharacterized protein n=1 Tax=Artomyces pyxidatus TaxID=48021 RepID=A0ACB8TCU9_9AGAM|nr:hypothetical protein BV25DRAFT_1797287 [Artomyces pyxidatus]